MSLKTKRAKRQVDPRQTKNERFRDGIKLWVGLYRSNIHRFAKDYMGLDLYLYQQILLYLMNQYSFFMYIAARGVD